MGFFSDLKEDLSQAVNELRPDETKKTPAKKDGEVKQDAVKGTDAALVEESFAKAVAMEKGASAQKTAADNEIESILGNALNTEKNEEGHANRVASDETSIITAGMIITGDVNSNGSMEVVGTINGNIDIMGRLNVAGCINGNSKASEVYAEGAQINGEVVSEGAVKIGESSVVIGNIVATSAVIAGAVKGDIDVKGPVILDASAIILGNIKSRSVQINNGAVIDGMCSQCYADVSPSAFFKDYKSGNKKAK